ncbi:ROK family protein [Allopontixanthobacter sediminis]|uniref:ROK family protein n=1 Tax=Allopontixanthobacter sediminis TaxID=1689985 RepID=UPI002FCDC9E3
MSGSGLLAGIEAGGTKFVLAVGKSPTEILAMHSVPTTAPENTLRQAADWFAKQGPIRALGIASFGPVELDRTSPRWGQITNTPKPGWSGTDIAGYFGRQLSVPVGFDTDVNGAAIAEARFGRGDGSESLAYVTVGTGIGGGLVVGGKLVHGAAHPEMGHLFTPRRGRADIFRGVCPHHGDCLEGLASGPAISARWGASLSDLGQDHEAHGLVAYYLAQLCHSIGAITATEVIVLGGGVLNAGGLIERVRTEAAAIDNGYLPGAQRRSIVSPALGDRSGIVGALILAEEAAEN